LGTERKPAEISMTSKLETQSVLQNGGWVQNKGNTPNVSALLEILADSGVIRLCEDVFHPPTSKYIDSVLMRELQQLAQPILWKEGE